MADAVSPPTLARGESAAPVADLHHRVDEGVAGLVYSNESVANHPYKDRLVPLQEAYARHGRDPDAIRVAIMGAHEEAAGLANLREEGVEHACLTVWSEDRDAVLRELDRFAETLRELRGAS